MARGNLNQIKVKFLKSKKMKKYIKLQENQNGFTHLKLELFYDKGGEYAINSKRGYYVMCYPVTVSTNSTGNIVSESFWGYSGFKSLILEVSRKSKKAEAEALQLIEGKQDVLINKVLTKHNLQLAA